MTVSSTHPSATSPERSALQRRPLLDGVLLVAVALVVVVVSMPRLSAYVRVSNEADVPAALGHFAEAREQQLLGPERNAPNSYRRTALGDVLARSHALHHRLRDARSTADGALVLHHGYLFRLESDGTLFAWPARSGRSGQRVFVRLPDGELRGHANLDGRWDGVATPPLQADLDRTGWTVLRPAAE